MYNTLAALVLSGLPVSTPVAAGDNTEFRPLDGLYEPSGAVQLNDGRILVIEDEPERSFSLLTLGSHGNTIAASKLRPQSLFDPGTARFNDLEGISMSSAGAIYTITSHSRKSSGKRDRSREQLVRFMVDENRISKPAIRRDLRKRLISVFPMLKAAARLRFCSTWTGVASEISFMTKICVAT